MKLAHAAATLSLALSLGCSPAEELADISSALSTPPDWSHVEHPRGCGGGGGCLTPLTEMSASDSYTDTAGDVREGGLYGRDTEAYAAHLQAGALLARELRPLDADGNVCTRPDCKLVVVSLGMSNTQQTWNGSMAKHAQDQGLALMQKLPGDPELRGALVFADTAQGGCTADQMAGFAQKNCLDYWDGDGYRVVQGLAEAGVSKAQVQVAWVKLASHYYQDDALKYLIDAHVAVLKRARQEFPNLKIAFISSRIYGGYAMSGNTEPYAYEQGLAVREVIGAQISRRAPIGTEGTGPGVPSDWSAEDLCYPIAGGGSSCGGPVSAPWIDWGVYAWANGVHPRAPDPFQSFGLAYLPPADPIQGPWDLSPEDGQHPSSGAQDKHSRMLIDWLKKHPASEPWLCASGNCPSSPPFPPPRP